MTAKMLGLEYACLPVIFSRALWYGWICRLGAVDLPVLLLPKEMCTLNSPCAVVVLYVHKLQVMFTSVGCKGMAISVFPEFTAQCSVT